MLRLLFNGSPLSYIWATWRTEIQVNLSLSAVFCSSVWIPYSLQPQRPFISITRCSFFVHEVRCCYTRWPLNEGGEGSPRTTCWIFDWVNCVIVHGAKREQKRNVESRGKSQKQYGESLEIWWWWYRTVKCGNRVSLATSTQCNSFQLKMKFSGKYVAIFIMIITAWC